MPNPHEHAVQLMAKMGFRAPYGPYASQLLIDLIERGVQRMSLFVPARSDQEIIAREVLAIWWAIERGHTVSVRCIDGPPIRIRYTWPKKILVVQWRQVIPWLLDQFDQFACSARVFWDRKVRKLRNPYK